MIGKVYSAKTVDGKEFSMRVLSRNMISDDTEVQGKTWRSIKEQVMEDDLSPLNDLSDDEQRLIDRLTNAQKEQGDMLELRPRPN